MKKRIAIACLSLAFFLNASTAFAKTLILQDVRTMISFPDGMTVIDPSFEEEAHRELSALGVKDSGAVLDEMRGSFVLARAVAKDQSFEFTLVQNDEYVMHRVWDFNYCGDEELIFYANQMQEKYAQQGIACITESIFRTSTAAFLVMRLARENGVFDVRSFFTVHDGQGISLFLASHEGELSEEMRAAQEDVAESIAYTSTSERPNHERNDKFYGLALAAFVYVVLSNGQEKRKKLQEQKRAQEQARKNRMEAISHGTGPQHQSKQ